MQALPSRESLISGNIIARRSGRADRDVPLFWSISKRIFDVFFAALALLASSPLLLCAALAVYLSSSGSPMYAQTRIGRGGRMFTIYKLRTMVCSAEKEHVPRLKKRRDDPRILPVGHILRRLSIDELPNLFNVLRGEMSLVGPRPMLPNEVAFAVERYGRTVAERRLTVNPGITGLWQVSGRSELDFDERVRLDILYAETWTPLGDLSLLLRTIPVLFFSRGAF